LWEEGLERDQPKKFKVAVQKWTVGYYAKDQGFCYKVVGREVVKLGLREWVIVQRA